MGLEVEVKRELGVLLDDILSADTATLELSELDRLVTGGQRLRSVLAARDAVLITARERALREPASAPQQPPDTTAPSGDPTPSPTSLPPAPPESSRDRSKRLLRAKWLGRCQRFRESLETGSVSIELVDVLAAALERCGPRLVSDLLADEAALVALAMVSTPEHFSYRLGRQIDRVREANGMARLQRQRADSRAWKKIDHETGMYTFGAVLDPERGRLVSDTIDQRMHQLYQTTGATNGLSEGQVRLQAIVDLVCGTAAVVPEALVIVDERTCRGGQHDTTVCETIDGVALPVETAINACAIGKVTVAITNADGRVVASGCVERVANRKQRRLLRAMYRTCAHPDCSVEFTACQVHHVKHWEHGGPTALFNLVPLCHVHHHLVHEGGWGLTIDESRTLRWYRPDGTLERTEPLVALVGGPLARPDRERWSIDQRALDGRDVERGPPPLGGDPGAPAQRHLFDPAA